MVSDEGWFSAIRRFVSSNSVRGEFRETYIPGVLGFE